jgi:hypothetical protein
VITGFKDHIIQESGQPPVQGVLFRRGYITTAKAQILIATRFGKVDAMRAAEFKDV